jgi:hypothetical protein
MAAIAALFQLMPSLLSEMFVFMTVFSALPIYIIARISPKAGLLSYIVADFLVLLLSVHEGLLFLFTNGIVGLSLGIGGYFIQRKSMVILSSCMVLASALAVVNYGIGIPVFGGELPGRIVFQIVVLLAFALIYNTLFYLFADFLYNRLKKLGFIDKMI